MTDTLCHGSPVVSRASVVLHRYLTPHVQSTLILSLLFTVIQNNSHDNLHGNSNFKNLIYSYICDQRFAHALVDNRGCDLISGLK